MNRETINSHLIINQLTENLRILFKNEINSNNFSVNYSDNFRSFQFDNIVFARITSDYYAIIFEEFFLDSSNDSEEKIKKKSSSLFIKKIYEEQNFKINFLNKIRIIFNEFYKNYNAFFEANFKQLLFDKIENTTFGYSFEPNKFEKPEIVVFCNTELKKEYGRYKAGEERIVYYKHFYNYKIEYKNKIENSHLNKINNCLFVKEHIMIQEIDELAKMTYSIPEGYKQYEGEIELELSKQVKASNIYDIKASTSFYPIITNDAIFKYYLYILLMFFEIQEIQEILKISNSTEFEKFEYSFVFFENFTTIKYFLEKNSPFLKIKTRPMNLNLIDNNYLNLDKEYIIKEINNKFNLKNLKEILEFYYINNDSNIYSTMKDFQIFFKPFIKG